MRKIITFILVVMSAMPMMAQKAVEWKDLLTIVDENRCTVYHDRQSQKPLKGDYRIKRGLDVEVVKLKDGIINGEYRRYRNGELREQGNYAKGKRDGMFTEYHVGGTVVSKQTPMSDGKIEGMVKTYFGNGDIDTEKEYCNGVEHGRERRYDKESGEQIYEANFVDGKKDGKEWQLADNGNGTMSQITRHYSDGMLNGSCLTELIRNGKVIYRITGQYRYGNKYGEWKEDNLETGYTTTTDYGSPGA